jgi:LmbE family N-acetylglucosaminyl deacetylase
MIAAHPDDENTALLAYFSRGRKLRTAYLSLTRGEGGQNLIGSEQGDALGVIRTQELLAARRIDGAEQFFTRAIDFGFTKTSQEALEKWGHDKILGDVVWVVRRFRPDVIVLRFSGTPRDGHGQHQVSAILGKEAFSAAADPKQFPEQLKWVQPWQAKRVMWNAFTFTKEQEKELEKVAEKVEVDPGEYDPILGHSYGEIAGMSRSLHKSQGMGAPEHKGSQKNYLVTVAGEPAKKDLLDGVDVTWDSVPGAGALSGVLAQAAHAFDPEHPDKTVPLLLKAKSLLAGLHHPVAERKRKDLDEAIALASGLWLEATADKFGTTPGGSFKITRTALNRGPLSILMEGKNLPLNEPVTSTETRLIAASEPYSQPYWLVEPKQGETYTVRNQLLIGLAENPPLLETSFHAHFASQDVELVRPVIYRYIDRVQGELTRPLIIEPPVAVETPDRARMFPDHSAKTVDAQIRANVKGSSGELSLSAPPGWMVEPRSQSFHLADVDQQAVLTFRVSPPAQDAKGPLQGSAKIGDRTVNVGMDVISYPHIPVQVLFHPADTTLVRAEVHNLAKTVGYVMGAGDEVPDSLRQIGSEVVVLSADDLARADLTRFDAIVTGVRAYNTRPDLRANQERLMEYVKSGGTMVVQYNVLEGGFTAGDPSLLAAIGPYPITVGRERVTVEEAPVAFPNPSNPVLHQPNEITEKDFEGWVQERGLYFASAWDSHYQPLFETHDPGQKPQLGGTLYAKYGKGVYIFTALSWFRELPAGVPGAYRIFANFISATSAQQPHIHATTTN